MTAFCAVFLSLSVDGAILADGGRTDYVIVLPPTATSVDRFAAEELQTFLGESTGARPEIVTDGEGRAKTIELGTDRAHALIGEDRVRRLETEETVYAVRGDAVAIVGGGATGNAYGVYSFLERELGCRWFTRQGDNLVPKHPTLELGDRTVTEKPVLAYRGFCGKVHIPRERDSRDTLFLFRNRVNWIANNFTNACRTDLRGKLVPRMWVNLPHCQIGRAHV